MTYEEIEEHYPEEFELRKVDKLAYRYPRGESYLDVIARLEPIVLEMERHTEPLLIIGHQVVLLLRHPHFLYHYLLYPSLFFGSYLLFPLLPSISSSCILFL